MIKHHLSNFNQGGFCCSYEAKLDTLPGKEAYENKIDLGEEKEFSTNL